MKKKIVLCAIPEAIEEIKKFNHSAEETLGGYKNT